MSWSANAARVEELLAAGRLDLARGGILDLAPGPMPADFDFGRVEGMMLGLAIGDALGNTTEGQLPAARRARHGEIHDYLPNPHAGGRAVGVPSDDSQLAFWTLEQLLADGGLDPERLAARFCAQTIFGIGSSVKQFVRNYRAGIPWHACGPQSAGTGALMRIAPVLIPHLKTGTPALWADTALAAMLTHNDAGSTAACLAFVAMLWQLLRMAAPPPPRWWLDSYAAVAETLETERGYRPRGGRYIGYEGPIWRFVAERVDEALNAGLSTLEACERWHSGAYLLETMPCVIYLLTQYGNDPEAAIVRAVNDTKDNDTIAAIVGAAVGALHGRDALPARWPAGLTGRTGPDDDGRMFELLAAARARWGG
jgi:ADP-ribosylglycohydrolase